MDAILSVFPDSADTAMGEKRAKDAPEQGRDGMTMLNKRILRLMLGGVVFAVVVGSTGCSSMNTAPQASAVPDAVVQNDLQDSSEAADAPAAPPPANVFGELDGVPHIKTQTASISVSNFQQHTFAEEGYDANVSVDPTGKWLVYASTRHSEHAGIYLQRVNGTSVTRLTSDDSDNAFPTFSADGRQIAYCSTRSGVWNVYVMDVDGRNSVQVTSTNNQCTHPSFSPDGTRLVYSELGSRSNQWELWTVNLGTGEKRQIGYGLFPSWSPERDVDRIAFQRARERGSHWFSLWTLDLIEGEGRRVTEVSVSSNAAIVSPSWSPDGKRLVFSTILDPAKSDGHRKGEQDVWTINSDGGDRRRLTDGNGVNLSPVWASDNRVFFISDRGGTESVWSVRGADGQAVVAAAPQVEKPKDAVGATDTGELNR
jgi:TolB protein